MNPKEQQALRRLERKIRNTPNRIQWSDLVGSPQVRHTAQERDRALQIGTAANRRDPVNPFRQWERPWLFWSVLKVGAVLIALCLFMVFGMQMLLNRTTQVAVNMLFLVPPMVIPVVLMVFFWELNVPGNITIWELASFFLVGTLLSLGGNALMFVLVEGGGGQFAAFREEPSKLLAGILILIYCQRNGKKIYGFTGLAIGAAVGSGFSAFESISYGLKYDFQTVIIRIFFAVVGHTLYSCSYLAALALHCKDNRITAGSFLNEDFLLTFLCSTGCHFLWNTSGILTGVKFAVTLVLLWYSALRITQKCMTQIGPRKSGMLPGTTAGARAVEIRCLRGGMAGKTWRLCNQTISIGRGSDNTVVLSGSLPGVSRTHCCLEYDTNGWIVMDAHSTYGTFLQQPGGRICKLTPGKAYPLSNGMLLYLGNQKFCLGLTFM